MGRLVYADDAPLPERGSFRVIQLHGRWYVVARGVFYQVDNCRDGVHLIAQLRAGVLDPNTPPQ